MIKKYGAPCKYHGRTFRYNYTDGKIEEIVMIDFARDEEGSFTKYELSNYEVVRSNILHEDDWDDNRVEFIDKFIEKIDKDNRLKLMYGIGDDK